jgi:hypothetical protein
MEKSIVFINWTIQSQTQNRFPTQGEAGPVWQEKESGKIIGIDFNWLLWFKLLVCFLLV